MRNWMGTRAAFLVLLGLWSLALNACDDPFGPRTWTGAPDTVQIWSASRLELQGFASALDLAGEPPLGVAIESTGSIGAWDVALLDRTGGLALAPAGFFAGHSSSRAGIAVITGTAFDALQRAPSDSASYSSEPVAVTADGVYVVRTRVAVCSDGTGSGVHYAKLRPLEIDVGAGRVRLEVVNNPYCGDRALVPTD